MNGENNEEVRAGFVILCCGCDKTRNDLGEWVRWENPSVEYAGVVYSHGLCPDCRKNLYGKELWYKQYAEKCERRALSGTGVDGEARKKMLIIDDNGVRTNFKAGLEADFEVEVSLNGSVGLVSAIYGRPDVILLDINMHDMSGVDVIHHLDSNAGTRKIPVIVLAADKFNDETAEKLRSFRNFRGVLSKTAPFEEIKEAVFQVLR
jgi:CheY-like chemotaxis protein